METPQASMVADPETPLLLSCLSNRELTNNSLPIGLKYGY